MAKKTDSTTKPAASAPLAAAAPVTPKPAKRAVKPAAKAKPSAKKAKASPARKKPAAKATSKTAPKKPAYTPDDVALRAYFISEKRRAHGLPGDEHHDWIEAERQLLAESTKSKKAKKA
jgi:hypothetical protein